MRKYANRGYGSCIVDTAKPTDDDMYSARWGKTSTNLLRRCISLHVRMQVDLI